jgi:hypothetical protein
MVDSPDLDKPKPPSTRHAPPVHSRWKKGQSGNPKGRPKGTSNREKQIQHQIQLAAELQLCKDAKKLLNDHAGEITTEVLAIALRQEATPSSAKVKCLLACFERIIPALKVVEVKDITDGKRPAEMTDAEIMEMMERMVNLAQSNQPQELLS